jgi:hypothetical protein
MYWERMERALPVLRYCAPFSWKGGKPLNLYCMVTDKAKIQTEGVLTTATQCLLIS